MILEKKYFGICLLLFLIISFESATASTVDSTKKTNRAFFGWYVGGGLMQTDFSDLRQSPYFINRPNNTYGDIAASIYLGNPDKLFFSLPFGLIIPKENAGTYLGYNMKVGFSGSYVGGSVGYQLYRSKNNKIFTALYVLAGVNQTNFIFTSRASGSGAVNADTTFYFEYSKVKTFNVNPEIIIELFNLVKTQDFFPSYPLTLKFGYNFQISNQKWTIFESSSPISQRNYAMNGFYFSLGVSFWLKKNSYGRK